MMNLLKSRLLPLSAEESFDLLRQQQNFLRWHPAVASVETVSSANNKRKVMLKDGLQWLEQTCAINACQRSLSVMIIESPFALSHLAYHITTWPISTAHNHCLMTWEVKLELAGARKQSINDWFAGGFIPAGLSGFMDFLIKRKQDRDNFQTGFGQSATLSGTFH